MLFYLGTHRPAWLERTAVPLFVSRRVMPTKRFPRALGPWALDSGAFTELANGGWSMPVRTYAARVTQLAEEIGQMAWAAPQDWMCEPVVLARTGLTVADHQRLTVQNFLLLRDLLGRLVVPVLQGWTLDDYLRCVDLYVQSGVDLASEPVVGLGTVCRRQDTDEAAVIVHALAGLGLALHGFGVKITGLRVMDGLQSADSMAWSYRARHADPLLGHAHKNCANCLDFALRWRQTVLNAVAAPRQMRLPTGGLSTDCGQIVDNPVEGIA